VYEIVTKDVMMMMVMMVMMMEHATCLQTSLETSMERLMVKQAEVTEASSVQIIAAIKSNSNVGIHGSFNTRTGMGIIITIITIGCSFLRRREVRIEAQDLPLKVTVST